MEYVIAFTDHAYEQYCRRVEPIDRDELEQKLSATLRRDRPPPNIVRAHHTWWATVVQGDTVVIVSCYGNGHMDMPAALTWAARHNDRLRLDDHAE